jgi:hypothetical protein
LDNNTYNLMMQLIEENQSLWQIKNNYIKDANSCGECQEFWKKLEMDKEEHIKDLEELVRKHLK